MGLWGMGKEIADSAQKYGSSAIRHIRIRNVLNGPVLVSMIVCPISIIAACLVEGPLAYCLFGLAAACALGVFACWLFFAIKDPKRLQTEDHRIRNASGD